jgi:hypothetical protein
MTACRFAIGVCAVGLFLAGCGSKTSLTEISGTVVYAGKPIEKGIIRFQPADGNSPTAAGEIAAGRYAIKVAPGNKQVQIEAFKVVGRRHHGNDPNSPMVDIQEQLLPDRYNAKTELVTNIAADSHVYDFALEK